MQYFLMAVIIIFGGGLAALFAGRSRSLSSIIGAASCTIGCAVAAWPVANILAGGSANDIHVLYLPLGPATMTLDAVSAFFALPVLILGPVAAAYFAATTFADKRDKGFCCFFFNLLVSAMLMLLCSANAILFLMAWEIMSVAAFFLITHRDEIATARNAGWRFLVASHIGTAGLFLLFALLSGSANSFEFSTFSVASLPGGFDTAIFFLALFGFGVKVGLLPLHVWLPDSYTFADAHVSAVLSGAMSKMGFYGLIRVMMFFPVYHELWGWTMAVGGLLTGVFAIITALAQSDIKKVIAYSSMENAGIILMALGCAVLAMVWKQPAMAFAAFAGALFHILNHSICKGLLFLGSGVVFFGTGTRKLEAMGGLAQKMPFSALVFGIGSAAIAGLPPFNNFISEFIIFLAGLKSAAIGASPALLLSAIILAGLGLIGGLAAACFARTFGLVFLGASRSDKKNEPEEVCLSVKLPMGILTVALLVVAFSGPWLIQPVTVVVNKIVAVANVPFLPEDVALVADPLRTVSAFSLALFVLAILGWQIRRRYFSEGDVEGRGTWDCGFAAPDARIQYTSSSFSQPVIEVFSSIIRPYRYGEKVAGLFPSHASFRTDSPDSLLRYLFAPLFSFIDRSFIPLRGLQHGRLHLYICYVAITLLLLLIWKVVAA